MSGILDGVRVIELTEALAGPYCAMMLGDFGADVIKVERPGVGDQSRKWGPPFVGEESAYFLATNRNKRSITLNYDRAEDLTILHRLLASADVFLCNQPSVKSLERRGLDPATLRAKHPRLIYCSITGYGFTGPKSGKPGYDILAQAEAGVMSFTGEPDGEPMRYPIAIADMTTGIYAAVGILGALFARERNGGEGDFLDMSLFDSQLTWLANIGSNYLNAGESPQRWGNAHPSIVPYQPFRGSDGRYFVVGVGSQPTWERLIKVLGIEELGEDARFTDNSARVKNREELVPFLQGRFDRCSTGVWLVRLSEAGIPSAAIQTVGEALADPQSMTRGLIVELEHPVLQTVRSIANPVRYTKQAIKYRLPPPTLGEHTNKILEELEIAEKEGRIPAGERQR
jgi:crotonobetainyl-CoA:carnitine CoA-transferase CaiB-like acyl-CoA transferase